jgi:hypothetical protein
MIAVEMVAAVVTIEVGMMIIKATVEGVHHIVGTLVIDMPEKKVVMILKAEKEDIDELKIPVERQARYQRDEPSSGDRKRRT